MTTRVRDEETKEHINDYLIKVYGEIVNVNSSTNELISEVNVTIPKSAYEYLLTIMHNVTITCEDMHYMFEVKSKFNKGCNFNCPNHKLTAPFHPADCTGTELDDLVNTSHGMEPNGTVRVTVSLACK